MVIEWWLSFVVKKMGGVMVLPKKESKGCSFYLLEKRLKYLRPLLSQRSNLFSPLFFAVVVAPSFNSSVSSVAWDNLLLFFKILLKLLH